MYTDTTLKDIRIIKGNYDKSEIIVRQSGGCDLITGFCLTTTIHSSFQTGKTYLLFLRQKQDVYTGFGGCGGKYLLRSDPRLQDVQIEAVADAIVNSDDAKWEEFLLNLYSATPIEVSPGTPGPYPGTPQ